MIRIAAAILIGMLSMTARAVEYMDATDEGQALTMAAVDIERAEHLREACSEERRASASGAPSATASPGTKGRSSTAWRATSRRSASGPRRCASSNRPAPAIAR